MLEWFEKKLTEAEDDMRKHREQIRAWRRSRSLSPREFRKVAEDALTFHQEMLQTIRQRKKDLEEAIRRAYT